MFNNLSNRKWHIATAVLGLLALIFFIVMLVFIVKYHNLSKLKDGEAAKVTGGASVTDNGSGTDSEMPATKEFVKSAEMYSDFTKEQYDAVIAYMKTTNLGIVPSADADLNSNYIYSIDPILPPKAEVLGYFNSDDASTPMIKAKVTLFMGASNPKAAKEVAVYPVDSPGAMEDFVNPGGKTPTWQSRPICNVVEAGAIDRYLRQTLYPLKPMLKAHHNMWYDDSCEGATCLFYGPVPRVVPGQTDRTVYIMFNYSPDELDDYYLWLAPMTMVIYTPGNRDMYEVKTITYDNIKYDSIQELVDAYDAGNVTNFTPGMQDNYVNSYGSPKRRGQDVNPEKLPPPVQVSEARRFSVDGRHVSWLGWEFDFVFRTISSAQFYNLRFNGESIAYQLGLQDIFVLYTGAEDNAAFRSYLDVGWSIGSRTSSLVKGYDCPESAEYITGTVYEVGQDRPTVLQNSACVFEYRNHIPLRRHYSANFFDYTTFRFNMNMADVVLVFRQILTVWNYDYIVDIEIHQNGVIKTSLSPTGYIQVALHSSSDGVRFGYDILPVSGYTALLHSHLFDFKVDLDIAGDSNSFMTVDFESEMRAHPYNPAMNMSYMVMKESLKSTEQESIIKYDFAKPKQYIVYNKGELNSRNNQPRGYRIMSESWANPILPADDALFTAASWVNHQMAVTKRKDIEDSTLSFFSQGDPYNPVISLSDFQEDNESIVDTDLVCWVSIGVNHLPTAEDIPVTTTAGKVMSFYLIPHNYYTEDPSIASRDAELSYPHK